MPGPPLNPKENQELNDQSPKRLRGMHPSLPKMLLFNKFLDGALLTGVVPLVAPESFMHIDLYRFSIL